MFVIVSSSCCRLVGRNCSYDERPQRSTDISRQQFLSRALSVRDNAVRLILEPVPTLNGGLMQYALLAYGSHGTQEATLPIDGPIATVLARPYVTGWARLHAEESATTVRTGDGRVLLTDGPFIETKEFLAGVIVVEADNLDGALAIAQELQEARVGGAIEVRPVRECLFRGA
jgi:hypothetical protein